MVSSSCGPGHFLLSQNLSGSFFEAICFQATCGQKVKALLSLFLIGKSSYATCYHDQVYFARLELSDPKHG